MDRRAFLATLSAPLALAVVGTTERKPDYVAGTFVPLGAVSADTGGLHVDSGHECDAEHYLCFRIGDQRMKIRLHE